MDLLLNSEYAKLALPNGKVVDVLSSVLHEIYKWRQVDRLMAESGGYIVGYQHKYTGNISLEAISQPYEMDVRERKSFTIRDFRHKLFLKRAEHQESYYMGVWHTHPQKIPEPSDLDWTDWKETLNSDKTGSGFVFFIIVGIDSWRMWVGDFHNRKIQEVFECQKDVNGIYSN